MKIGLHLYNEDIGKDYGVSSLDDISLQFAKQIGVSHIISCLNLPVGEGYWDFIDLLKHRKNVEAFGLKLGALENIPNLHMDKVLLGEDGRDEQIEKICITIKNMGKAGIKNLGIAFMITGPSGYWRVGNSGGGRGNAGLFSFDYDLVKKAPYVPRGEFWGSSTKAKYYNGIDTLGRVSKEEMWERFVYLLKKIVPAAEESGVKICIHPSDPPVAQLRGIERILNCVSDFKKMFEMFPSKNLGLDFCQGTFSEMQDVGSEKIFDIIRYFGEREKIFYVHFRNVRGVVPKYDEVFIDEGDVDMIKALKTYKEVGFDGILVTDHTPFVTASESPWKTGMAYATGFIKAAIKSLDTN
jgi:mannonate dehydratase